MSTKRFLLVAIFVLFFIVQGVMADPTPNHPNLQSPPDGTTFSTNSVTLCATIADNLTSEAHFELYPSSEGDFQTNYKSTGGQGSQFCDTVPNLPNGTYGWQARARNSKQEEGGASPDWKFIVQVGNQPAPTRVPGPQGPTAVPERGPDFDLNFNPHNDATIGQNVTISVSVHSTNPGGTTVRVACGSVDKAETSEVSFNSNWNTNGCGNGDQTVTVCARSVSDQQGQNANCQSRNYHLNGSAPAGSPSANFWADSRDIQTGQCTTLHWTTQNATNVDVNIDGQHFNSGSGDRQVCPTVNDTYSLRASNGNGNDATANVEIHVSGVNMPPAVTNGSGGGSSIIVGSPYVPGMTFDQARQSGMQGGFDLIKVAYAAGYGNAHNDNGRWDGWILDGNGHSGIRLTMDNFQWICQQVYGSNWSAHLFDDSQGGVRCVQNGGGNTNPPVVNPQANPPVSNNNCGALAPELQIGQPAMVTQNGKSLNLRTGPGVRENLIEVLQPGAIGQVIGDKVCKDGYYWFQVQFGNETGWVAESGSGYYWIQTASTAPQPQPTQAPVQPNPVQPPVQQNQGGDIGTSNQDYSTYQCDGLTAYHSSSDTIFASDIHIIGEHGGQCGEFVINQFKQKNIDITVCVANPPSAPKGTPNLTAEWPENIVANYQSGKTNCNWTIDSSPVDGAIVTWDAGCPFGVNDKNGNPLSAGTDGHAAIVTFTPSEMNGRPNGKSVPNTILVDESNYGGNEIRYTNATAYLMESCMHFIHVPGTPGAVTFQGSGSIQPGQGIASASVTAQSIDWSLCLVNCTPSASVNFYLPTGHYNLKGYRLTFMGNDIPIQNSYSAPGSTTDKIIFVIGTATIQQEIDNGHNADLSNLSNWRLYYTATA